MTRDSSYLNDNGGTVPDSSIGDQGAALLIADIQDTRSMLSGLSLSTTPQVGTSDAGSYFNTHVLQAVDYGVRPSTTVADDILSRFPQMANVHPWFANVSADDSASWTANFFQEVDVYQAGQLPNNATMYIAETGWPTVGLGLSVSAYILFI